jgi:hypothetical protein
MMKLTISAAALIAVAAFVTVPASAEHLGGGPIKQNGKCWKGNTGRDATFGTWVDCAQAASGGVGCEAGQLAWEKSHVGQQFFDHCARNGNANSSRGTAPAGAPQRASR